MNQRPDKSADSPPADDGVVVAVRGCVVDVRFAGTPPTIHNMLHAGDNGRIAIEVLAQRDAHHVRGIALTPTQGLAGVTLLALPAFGGQTGHNLLGATLALGSSASVTVKRIHPGQRPHVADSVATGGRKPRAARFIGGVRTSEHDRVDRQFCRSLALPGVGRNRVEHLALVLAVAANGSRPRGRGAAWR